ncbi:MAG: hypothetical protein AAGK00_02560 [Pseudomonadota bacterium]
MTEETFHWCQLANGDKRTAGYIEARGAKVGAQVEMIDLDGELWDVLSVGEAVSKDFVRKNEKRFKGFQESLRGGGIDE